MNNDEVKMLKKSTLFRHAQKYPECPMRHKESGNCLVVGGFCVDAISDEICEALHQAYDAGFIAGAEKMKQHLLR